MFYLLIFTWRAAKGRGLHWIAPKSHKIRESVLEMNANAKILILPLGEPSITMHSKYSERVRYTRHS